MTRYIDADALIDTLYEHEFSSYIDKGAVSTLINDEPTVDAVPVRHAKLLNAHPYGECSNCGYLIDIREEFNYCPNCGAKIDERKEE